MHVYVHTYMHAYIHTYLHTYIHTYIHTYLHTYRRTFSKPLNNLCIMLHLIASNFATLPLRTLLPVQQRSVIVARGRLSYPVVCDCTCCSTTLSSSRQPLDGLSMKATWRLLCETRLITREMSAFESSSQLPWMAKILML